MIETNYLILFPKGKLINMSFSVTNIKYSSFINSRFFLSIILIVSFISIGYSQYKIPKKPEFQTSVYDYINLLNSSQKKSLENKLIKYSDSTSTQIVVAIINSTEGEYINYLGTKWAQQWGIGQSEKDNGIFILLAKNDRKIGINSGQGVEHLLTDAVSRRIIERDIIPYFKKNDYYSGLNKASESIFEVMTGEYKGTRSNTNNEFPIGLLFFLFIVFIIILIAISKNRKGGGGDNGRHYHDSTGRNILEAIILSNSGRGGYRRGSGGFGGGGSFGSGGGFGGGFGGGSFGGGGASGGW